MSLNRWTKLEAELLYASNHGGYDSHPDWGFVVAGGEGALSLQLKITQSKLKDSACTYVGPGGSQYLSQVQVTKDGKSFSNPFNMQAAR